MCRREARDAYARATDMQAAGAARIVALVKEDVGTEVQDFREFWGGEILLDGEQKFYEALGGGKPHKPYGLASFLAVVANPFSKSRVKKNLDAAKKSGVTQNMTGEGFVAGGVYVMDRNGAAAYSHLEADLGDEAPMDDIIKSVADASKS